MLTFFHADFGKEFPSRTLWRGASRSCPSPSSTLYPFLYRIEHFSRGRKGEKVPRKGEEEGWPAKGGKKEKRTRENRSVCLLFCGRRYLRNLENRVLRKGFLIVGTSYRPPNPDKIKVAQK